MASGLNLLRKFKGPVTCVEGIWSCCVAMGLQGGGCLEERGQGRGQEGLPLRVGPGRTQGLGSQRLPQKAAHSHSCLFPLPGHLPSSVHWPRLGRHAGVEHGSLLP